MGLVIDLQGDESEAEWVAQFAARLGGYPVWRRGEAYDRKAVRYVFTARPGPQTFDGLGGLRAILSFGAGVDGIMAYADLPDVPVVRFVDADLSRRMSEYVLANVLLHHRLTTLYQAGQRERRWQKIAPGTAPEIGVGIMGLGVLGQAAAEKLRPLGYRLNGWSRTGKSLTGMRTYAGAAEREAFLGETDILVCLLPLTADTRGILDKALFQKLRRGVLAGGPAVINAARGGHLVVGDLVAALRDGTLGAASLDVFEIEPLPKESPLWGLENCFITPHVAAVSDPSAGADYFAAIIKAHEAGAPLPNVVDRGRGY